MEHGKTWIAIYFTKQGVIYNLAVQLMRVLNQTDIKEGGDYQHHGGPSQMGKNG